MGKAYGVTWFVVVFLPLVLMIGLYSRVVYALWFKHDDSQLDHQQMVRVLRRILFCCFNNFTTIRMCGWKF